MTPFTPSGISHEVDLYPNFDATADGTRYSINGTITSGWVTMEPSSAEIDVQGDNPDPDGAGAGYCFNSVFTTYTAQRVAGG